MKTVRVKKGEKYYIAKYTTLDLVSQGETKEEALSNLFDLLVLQIDYAVENDNLANLVPPGKRCPRCKKPMWASKGRSYVCISCGMKVEYENKITKATECEMPGCRVNTHKVNDNYCRKHRKLFNGLK